MSMTGKPGMTDPGSCSGGMPHEQRGVTVGQDVEIPLPADGETWTVGAVILDPRGHAFARKRSADRRLFPTAGTSSAVMSSPANRCRTPSSARSRRRPDDACAIPAAPRGAYLDRRRRVRNTARGRPSRRRRRATWIIPLRNGPSTPPTTGSAPTTCPAMTPPSGHGRKRPGPLLAPPAWSVNCVRGVRSKSGP